MHLEAITSKAEEVLNNLPFSPPFYLAGGTGLALQIGHRKSVDLDFFTQEDFSNEIVKRLEKVFGQEGVVVKVNQKGHLTVEVLGVQTSFIGYPFPVFSELVEWKDVLILPVLEIAAMKAYTIGRRATFKDYVDLYFVVKKGHANLEKIMKLSKKKYGEAFSRRLFLEQLVYFEDIPEQEIIFLGQEVSKEKVKKFFQRKIRRFNF